MQLSIWIIVIAVVAGPVLLGLWLHRAGFSRAVALGIASAVLGATAIVSREPLIDSSQRHQVESPATSSIVSQSQPEAESRPKPAAVTEANRAMLEEIKALSAKISELEAAIEASRNDKAALEGERAAHRDTLHALEAANARLAMIEADRQRPEGEPSREKPALEAAREELKAARLRLAIAEAEIERLKAALRAAEPVATALPFPATPAPFAHTPASEPATNAAATQSRDSVAISTGATGQTGADESRSAAIGRTLAKAMRSASFALLKLAGDEIVEGRRGSYYRITCPGGGNKPLSFGPGDYTFEAGNGPLTTCFKAVQSLLLDALPTGSEQRLYVQGYASLRGFIRPKRFTAREAHLKTVDYLPRLKGTDRFSTARVQQSTGKHLVNAELPNLRAAYVANSIAEMTKGAVRPEILEGELKPGNHAASQSFALLLQVKG